VRSVWSSSQIHLRRSRNNTCHLEVWKLLKHFDKPFSTCLLSAAQQPQQQQTWWNNRSGWSALSFCHTIAGQIAFYRVHKARERITTSCVNDLEGRGIGNRCCSAWVNTVAPLTDIVCKSEFLWKFGSRTVCDTTNDDKSSGYRKQMRDPGEDISTVVGISAFGRLISSQLGTFT
jgi:hypothetical protein